MSISADSFFGEGTVKCYMYKEYIFLDCAVTAFIIFNKADHFGELVPVVKSLLFSFVSIITLSF